MTLRRLKRRLRQRRILLLIDVSGSMKERTETASAHRACAGARGRAHRGVHLRHAAHARHARDAAQEPRAGAGRDLQRSSATGTAARASATPCRPSSPCRALPAIRAARSCSSSPTGWSAATPAAMREAVTRLSRLAWRVSWLTPLAADPNFTPQTEGLKAILPLVDDLADGSSVAAVCAHVSIWKASGPHDRYRRRASSHLAAGRHAVALRPDAAAHLRAVRADPARLSDRRIPRGPRRHRRREVGLRAGELAEGEVRGRGRVGERGRGRARLAARHRRLCGRDRRRRAPAARPADEVSADARRAHAAALARERDLPLRGAAGPCGRPEGPAQYRGALPTTAGASTCRCSRRRWRAPRSLPPRARR